MLLNSKSTFILFVLFLSFCLSAPPKIFSYEIGENKKAYAQLIQIYKEWLDLEDEVFKMLTFKLSSHQVIREGYRAKFTLEDNLGRKWIFKPDYLNAGKSGHLYCYVKGEVAVIVYRVYRLFGLQTPRIHFITLNINGKKISGSIQKFVSNEGTLLKRRPGKISLEALNYLLKSHVLDWLLANYDANPQNFLVLSFNQIDKPDTITRVDNEGAFVLLGKDELRYDWIRPWDKKPSTKYYYHLWNDYIFKKINLDVEKNLAFIKFVSEFPDDFFEKLILPVRTHDFKEPTHSEFERLKDKYKDFLEPILLRKYNLIKDFEKFYGDLAQRRGESLGFNKYRDYQQIIVSVSKNLIEEKEKLREEKLKLKEATSYPSKIDVIFSLEGFNNLFKVYHSYWEEKGNLISLCNDVLETLSYLKASTKNKYEKKALRIYIEEVRKICSGKPPSFHLKEINKVVGSVIPE